MRFCIDIDETICRTTGTSYELSKPIAEAVKAIQNIKAFGHYVIMFTARGSGTGIDYAELTTKQLSEWGVPYDELRFGKPFADIYIDDKAMFAKDWLSAWGESETEDFGSALGNIIQAR